MAKRNPYEYGYGNYNPYPYMTGVNTGNTPTYNMNILQAPTLNPVVKPVEEIGKTMAIQEDRHQKAQLAYNTMMEAIAKDKVLDKHAGVKESAVNKWNEVMTDVKESGNYGNRVNDIINSTTAYKTNEALIAARNAKAKADQYVKEIDADKNLDGNTKSAIIKYMLDNVKDIEEIAPGVYSDNLVEKPQVGKYYDPVELGNKLMNFVKPNKDLTMFDLDTDQLQYATPEQKAALHAIFGSETKVTKDKLAKGLYGTLMADKNITSSYQERQRYNVPGFGDMSGDIQDVANSLAGLYSYNQENVENLPDYDPSGEGSSSSNKPTPLIATTNYQISNVSVPLNGGRTVEDVTEYVDNIVDTDKEILDNTIQVTSNKSPKEIKENKDKYYNNAQNVYVNAIQDAINNTPDGQNVLVTIGDRTMSKEVAEQELKTLIANQEKLNQVESRIKVEKAKVLPEFTDKDGNIDYNKIRRDSERNIKDVTGYSKQEFQKRAGVLANTIEQYNKQDDLAKSKFIANSRTQRLADAVASLNNIEPNSNRYNIVRNQINELKSDINNNTPPKQYELIEYHNSDIYKTNNKEFKKGIKKVVNEQGLDTYIRTDLNDAYTSYMLFKALENADKLSDEEYVKLLSGGLSTQDVNDITGGLNRYDESATIDLNNVNKLFKSTPAIEKLSKFNDPTYTIEDNGTISMDGRAGNYFSIKEYYGHTSKEFKDLNNTLTKQYREILPNVPGKFTPDDSLLSDGEFNEEFKDQIESGNLTTKDLSGSPTFHIDYEGAGTTLIPYGESYWTGVAPVYKLVHNNATGKRDKKQVIGNITFGVGGNGIISNPIIEEQQNKPEARMATSIMRNLAQSNLATDYDYTNSFDKTKLSNLGIHKITINGEKQKIYVEDWSNGSKHIIEYNVNDKDFINKFKDLLKENISFDNTNTQVQ